MNVAYTERAKQVSEQYSLLQQATSQLEEALGQSAGEVTVQWDCTEGEKGRPIYLLRLKDFLGEATGRFTLDELRSPSQMSFRIYRTWGDLLQVHTEKRLEQLLGTEGLR